VLSDIGLLFCVIYFRSFIEYLEFAGFRLFRLAILNVKLSKTLQTIAKVERQNIASEKFCSKTSYIKVLQKLI